MTLDHDWTPCSYICKFTDRGISTVKSPSATVGDGVITLGVRSPCCKAFLVQALVGRAELTLAKLDPIYAAISNSGLSHFLLG